MKEVEQGVASPAPLKLRPVRFPSNLKGWQPDRSASANLGKQPFPQLITRAALTETETQLAKTEYKMYLPMLIRQSGPEGGSVGTTDPLSARLRRDSILTASFVATPSLQAYQLSLRVVGQGSITTSEPGPYVAGQSITAVHPHACGEYLGDISVQTCCLPPVGG